MFDEINVLRLVFLTAAIGLGWNAYKGIREAIRNEKIKNMEQDDTKKK